MTDSLPLLLRSRAARVAVATAVVAAAAALAVSGAGAARTAPAPMLSNPTATGKALVTRFFRLLEAKDSAGLQSFLSPALRVQPAEGTGSGKAACLAKLPTVVKFTLTKVAATEADGALVVRHLATVEGTVNGKPYTPGPAPRLSTFSWNGTAWQLAAHANVNPLTG